MASGSMDTTAKIWDVTNGLEKATLAVSMSSRLYSMSPFGGEARRCFFWWWEILSPGWEG